MTSGFDPGQLGFYGFRNRKDHSPHDALPKSSFESKRLNNNGFDPANGGFVYNLTMMLRRYSSHKIASQNATKATPHSSEANLSAK